MSRKKSNLFSASENKKTLHKNLEFTAVEQYKLLRTNLSFTLPEGENCSIIGVTSAMRGEGKSTTAVNLSYVMAESGKKVLLIDGDLRIPSIAKKMDLKNDFGLSDLLRGATTVQMSSFKVPDYNNWYIMPSGALPPNPSELMGSARMKNVLRTLAENFDCIIIDLPPVNLVSDALAVSKYISGMVIVVRADYTEKKELESCFRQLDLSDVNVLGCVINDDKMGKGSYSKYKYRKYYKYYKSYGDNFKLISDITNKKAEKAEEPAEEKKSKSEETKSEAENSISEDASENVNETHETENTVPESEENTAPDENAAPEQEQKKKKSRKK